MNWLPTSNLPVFVAAVLALLLTPGPAVLYIVTRSTTQGRPAGIASVLGIELASLLHMFAAALGLSALLVTSALAFDVVKYVGAAYLIYLGVRKFLERDDPQTALSVQPQSLMRTFRQGVVVNVLNPKTALFFYAFLPQFVDKAKGNVSAQIIFLGLLFVTLATLTDSSYALIAGTIAKRLSHIVNRTNRRLMRYQRYLVGSIYIGLGVAAASASLHEN